MYRAVQCGLLLIVMHVTRRFSGASVVRGTGKRAGMRRLRPTPLGALLFVGLAVTVVLTLVAPSQGVFIALAVLLVVVIFAGASSLSTVRYGALGSHRGELGKTAVEIAQREHGLRDL